MAGGLSQVPEGRHVFPGLTVMENLEMGAFLKKTGRKSSQLERKFSHAFLVLKNGRTKMQLLFQGRTANACHGTRPHVNTKTLTSLDEPSMGFAPIFTQRDFDIIQDIQNKEQPSS